MKVKLFKHKPSSGFYKNIFLIYSFFYACFLFIFILDFKFLEISKVSAEMTVHSQSKFAKFNTKAVAASCGFMHGWPDEFTACTTQINCNGTSVTKTGQSQCGGVCQPIDTICPVSTSNTGANAPKLTPVVFYYSPITLISNTYYFKSNAGIPSYLSKGGPRPGYTITPTPPASTICTVTRLSSDGTNNATWTELYRDQTVWGTQPEKEYPYRESIRVSCAVNSVLLENAAWSETQAQILNSKWNYPCTSPANVCNQTATGVYNREGVCSADAPTVPSCQKENACGEKYTGSQCGSVCTAGEGVENMNASCIQSFRISPAGVYPNGSVKVSWQIPATKPNITRRCGVMDTTIPSAPREMPGLQNLSENISDVQLENIQRSSQFTLKCSFYKTDNGSLVGNAAMGQWVRVINLGEQ